MDQTTVTTIDQPGTRDLPSVAPATPMQLLASAIDRGMSPETIEKLMVLNERFEASQARKEFDAAMASAKAEIQPITKNKTVKYPSKDKDKQGTEYAHEDLAGIARAIDPILTKNGLSYRWRTSSEPNHPIKVTCIIAHRLGHNEETTLCAGADSSGSKNSIQAIGSTVTYLQRYTLKAALGLAATKDDDGKASGEAEFITKEQTEELTKLIIDTGGDVAKFCEFAKVEALENIYASRYEAAVEAVNRAAAQRKKSEGTKSKSAAAPTNKPTDDTWPGPISKDQAKTLLALIVETKSDLKKFCKHMGVQSVEAIGARDYDRAVTALESKKKVTK